VRVALALAAAALLAGCAAVPPAAPAPRRIDLVDAARQRLVPLLLYGRPGPRRPLAIVSHGYGGQPGEYSFIAEALAARGYVVAAIDHELPGDPPIASDGNLFERRMPNWQTGAQSIAFVIAELRARRLVDPQAPAVVIGHSNGGDMTMLLASEHPELARAAISLDSRRFPLPRTRSPRICSIRSADQPADPGVLPNAEEARALGMQIAQVPGLIHNDMWDGATLEQRAAMLGLILRCLRG
jgi:pimeloyl-ACP methyl ester carboxylesterase